MRHLCDDVLYLSQFSLSVAHGSQRQRPVKQHAAVVDPFVDVIVSQLFSRQRTLRLRYGTHGPHVLFAIVNHLLHQLCVLAELAVALRNGQRADQLSAAVVFLHGSASEAAHILKATRRTVGAGLRCGAVELLQLKLDLKDIPEYQALKRCVVRVHQPLVIFDGPRERLTGEPRPHVFVIKCV